MVPQRTMQDGRLGGPPNEVNLRHAVEPYLRSELAELRSFVAVDMAHTIMLAEQGILTTEQAGSILASLEEIDTLGPESFPTEPEYGSLLLQIERFIAERAGEDVAGRMHTGRSRNDQSAAVSRLVSRDRLIEVLDALLRLQVAVLSVAGEHLDTYMPGYTHLQHAQPTTLAHYLMRHWFTFERDQQRLEGAFERTNLSSLGGAAMAGTSWRLDRQRVSELLGHERPVENAYDAGIFARDYPAENAAALSILVNNVGRLAGDMYLWSTWEFGMAEIDDSLAGTSSIMPQKKNPHALERIRGLAGKAVGWLPATLGMLRSVSSSDLELLFGGDLLPVMAEDTLSALELMRVSIESMHFNEEVMRDRADIYWSTATNLADEIVRHSGLSFRTVHGIVGRLVRLAVDRSLGPSEVSSDLLDEAAEQTIGRPLEMADEFITRALDPVGSIDGLTTPGSAHPHAVRVTIDTAASYELTHRTWLEKKRSQIESASAMRWETAHGLVQAAGGAGSDRSSS
jgi:argininosuccinate lyase